MLSQAELWYAIGHASALKYDGEGLVAAMDRALELGAPPGEVYPELALPVGACAPACGRVRLDDSLTADWVSRAVADSADGTSERASGARRPEPCRG